MGNKMLFPLGTSESCLSACSALKRSGFQLTDHPSPDITHLLLDIPGAEPGNLKELLRMLPKNITVIGGSLSADYLMDYRKLELLKNPVFLARNAAITAECALRATAPYLTTIWIDSPALILGWGRIGKCLGKLLKEIGCPVTIAARKETDRAMLSALGYRAVEFSGVKKELPRHKVLFNTVPQGIALEDHTGSCIKIDLASFPGLEGHDIIRARGLPGKYAPESAGKLIAETICRMDKEERI